MKLKQISEQKNNYFDNAHGRVRFDIERRLKSDIKNLVQEIAIYGDKISRREIPKKYVNYLIKNIEKQLNRLKLIADEEL